MKFYEISTFIMVVIVIWTFVECEADVMHYRDMAHRHAEMKRRRRLDAKKIYAFASLREAKIDERKHAFYCKRILDNGLRLSFGCMEMVFWGCQRVSASASGSVSRRRSDDQAFSAFLKLSRVRVFQFVAILKFKLELTLARNLN